MTLAKAPMVDRCAETVQTLTLGTQGSTVDRFKATVVTREDSESSDEDMDNVLNSDHIFNRLEKTNVHGRCCSHPNFSRTVTGRDDNRTALRFKTATDNDDYEYNAIHND